MQFFALEKNFFCGGKELQKCGVCPVNNFITTVFQVRKLLIIIALSYKASLSITGFRRLTVMLGAKTA